MQKSPTDDTNKDSTLDIDIDGGIRLIKRGQRGEGWRVGVIVEGAKWTFIGLCIALSSLCLENAAKDGCQWARGSVSTRLRRPLRWLLTSLTNDKIKRGRPWTISSSITRSKR